ncbi:MAG: class I SAM-dependent methyltransferase [Calditrichaeota bacterium]|nr:class I SAM-dependent methyltransferase [Calditrichota bacterium]RQW00086.1 MAG: class I SAM-dependent methyltransferase [Calditrichota bacterium]
MKRQKSSHDPVFHDLSFADRYARKHMKMAENFGKEYSAKLEKKGFKNGRILDTGCGFGGTLIYLARNIPEAEFYGIDLSDPLLDIAILRVRKAGLSDRVDFQKEDVHRIPFDDNYFNVVLNINMVHLVDDPVTMLNEMERVLVPDGSLFIADIRRSWIGYLDREFKSALTLSEAKKIIGTSNLRKGSASSSLLWWRYENG